MFDFIRRPFLRRFGRDSVYYKIIDDVFGICPDNIELYKLALVHKSASLFLDDGRQINNERLEFLGDAVIETVVSDYIFIEYPEADEGFLTKLRSKIVSRQLLNGLAVKIGLDKHVIAQSSGTLAQKHIFGDALEAMIGAIYLDKGYNFVNRLLINELIGHNINIDEVMTEETDFKSRLIEWCQKSRQQISFRTVHDANYSDSHPLFLSTVVIDGVDVGHGTGESKKQAEQRASASVWNVISDNDLGDHLLEEFDRFASGQ